MIFLSPLIKDALYFSARAHDGQYRKGGDVPYIVHPVLVALLVSEYVEDEKIIAAALLHDVLEDCPSVLKKDIENACGRDVGNLVEEVSFLEEDVKEWKEKKERYLEKIRTVSDDALLIIAADKMANMKAYFEALASQPEKVAALFKADPEEYRWYYGEVFAVLEGRLRGNPIVVDYSALLSGTK